MAVAALLRSLARKMARAPSTHHRPARGLHEALPSITGRPTLSTAAPLEAAAGLPSLATKLARAPPPQLLHRFLPERGLHSLNNKSPNFCTSGPTPPISKQELRAQFAKYRAGIAYVSLFSILAYLKFSVIPRLDRLDNMLEARGISNVSTNVPEAQIMQSSGHGKQPVGEIGRDPRLKDFDDAMAKLEKSLKSAPFNRKV